MDKAALDKRHLPMAGSSTPSTENSLLISVAAEARLIFTFCFIFLATAYISSCTSQSSLHLLPPVLAAIKEKMIGYRIKRLTEDVVIRCWKDNCMEISLNFFFISLKK